MALAITDWRPKPIEPGTTLTGVRPGSRSSGTFDRWIEVMVERRLVGRDTTFVGRFGRFGRGWLEEGFGDGACYGVGR
ncbi:hypothetical protein SAMN05661093_08064 [Kibdelosporangium aridum]|uniref:Uncharacterized protein n=1 Tax=Kibdelosporangium aridum TaxID=2030 RepID=A0A1W2FPG2_KIBAR|nr:hypothetical protein SAMN05661093_08064 [Kibdelosporangium aridum]